MSPLERRRIRSAAERPDQRPAWIGSLMEKRAILAAVLMAGLLILYQFLFVRPPEAPPPAPDQKQAVPAPAPAPTVVTPPTTAGPTAAVPVKEAPSVPQRTAVVETPLYRAVVDSRGGRFTEWTLHYRGEKPMVVDGVFGPTGVAIVRAGAPAVPISFALSSEALTLGADRPQGELRLTGEDGFGLKVTETLRFRADSYVVERDLRVENVHTVPQAAEIRM